MGVMNPSVSRPSVSSPSVPRVRHGRDGAGEVNTVRIDGGVAATPMHAHVSLILGCVDTGQRALRLADGVIDVSAGEGFLIPPETAHAWVASDAGSHRIVTIDARAFDIPRWRAGLIRDVAWTASFLAVHAAVEAGRADVHDLVTHLLELTDALATRTPENRASARPVRLARRVLSERFDVAIDLKELSRRVGVSPYHLHRLYSRTCGLTPAETRFEARLREARRLILGGEGLANVAAELGFADQSHLNRAFRRLMGVPPGVWAKQVRRHG